ncbi:MAG: hypothetical protein AB7F67_09830 [Rhodospirillaceae bacterium]
MSPPHRLAAAARWTLGHPAAIACLVVLGIADAVLAGVHLIHLSSGFAADPRANLGFDGGHGEWFEYAKTLLCAAATAAVWQRTRQPVYAALALVYAFVLADNALEIHERADAAMAVLFAPAAPLFADAPQVVAQAVFYLAVGGAIAAGLSRAFRRSAPAHRRCAALCVAAVTVLAGFAVGVDLLHAAVTGMLDDHDLVLGFAEDGGELAALTLNAWVAAGLYARLAAPRPSAAAAGR